MMSARPKTVGPQTAKLLTALYDRAQTTFTIADAEEITGLQPTSASTLLHKAVKRGLISRLKRGVFIIVPPELGSAHEYFGSPYLTAKLLASGAPLFISHGSAMEIHRMVTQPQLVLFASSTKRIQKRVIHGTEYRFVFLSEQQFFGTVKHWVTKQESVDVSDLERTVIDGLRQPEYCGGITEVAKGLWMRRQDVEVSKLVTHALRLRVGAVVRRLGYLLEIYGLGGAQDVAKLQRRLTATYSLLDPMLPSQGRYIRRWRLRLNVAPEELQHVRET